MAESVRSAFIVHLLISIKHELMLVTEQHKLIPLVPAVRDSLAKNTLSAEFKYFFLWTKQTDVAANTH